jgi:VCBS repeat-containing protein
MRRRWTLEELDARLVPTYLGNQIFPLDNPWNQNVAGAPVAANSAAIISAIVARHNNTAPGLHPDFGNPVTDGALYGIPINVADNSTPKYTITISPDGWASESDNVQVPIPNGAVIEGDGPTGPSDPADPSVRGDSHLLVYDRDANVLYELGSAARPDEASYPYGGSKPLGVWGAYQVSYWDLNKDSFRTIGATSADAAGLPILPGLVRPDEANPPSAGGVGVIDHAIRMTVVRTQTDFVYPASHEAGYNGSFNLPRMGDRFRLKTTFVIPSTWSPEAQAIAQAMKTYGLIVADNGSDMFFQGTPSDQWNMDDVLQLRAIKATDFDVVDLTPRVTGLSRTSGDAAGGTPVTISGMNFSGAAGQLHVFFGTVEATSVQIVSDTQLLATAPVHTVGTVDVRVQSGTDRLNTDGQLVFFGYGTSATSAADKFAFGNLPVAANDVYSVLHDHTLTIGATAGVLANDASNPVGHTLTAARLTGPGHGTLTLNTNGSFSYKPAAGYTGSEAFTYEAKDGLFASTPATVTVNVTDQAPTAGNDSYKTTKGRTLTVLATAGLLANDADADRDRLTAVLASGPSNGTVTLNANGSFIYIPNAGFVGTDTFTYAANDKALSSAPATVTVTVPAPPQVKSVVINDGSAQRSMVRSITVTFDTLVTLDVGAFQVIRSDGVLAGFTKTLTQVNGETQVVLNFTGAGTSAGSLLDGRWTLKVVRTRVHRADYRPAAMSANSLTSFFRLYGDSNGDRTVDAIDQAAFAAAFGQTDITSLATFDVNRDGKIDAIDQAAFNRRLGHSI